MRIPSFIIPFRHFPIYKSIHASNRLCIRPFIKCMHPSIYNSVRAFLHSLNHACIHQSADSSEHQSTMLSPMHKFVHGFFYSWIYSRIPPFINTFLRCTNYCPCTHSIIYLSSVHSVLGSFLCALIAFCIPHFMMAQVHCTF